MPAGYGCDQCGSFMATPTGDQVLWQLNRHCAGAGLFGHHTLDTQTFFFCSLRCLGVWAAARPEFDRTTAGGPTQMPRTDDPRGGRL